MIFIQVAGMGVSLLVSAMISGVEMAFFSASRPYFDRQKKQGIYSGIVLSAFFIHPSRLHITLRITHLLALTTYAMSIASLLTPWLLASLPAIPVTTIVVLIIEIGIAATSWLLVAEILPRRIFLSNPEKLLSVAAVPLRVLYLVLYPVVWVVEEVFCRLTTSIADTDILPLRSLTMETLPDTRPTGEHPNEVGRGTQTSTNAIDFKTIRVRECMIRRTEIVAVELNDGIDALRNAFVTSGHSKIIVYRTTIDDVAGYAHAMALFKKPKNIAAIVSPLMVVSETMLLNELLVRFTNGRKTIALVVDEYGGTSGLISMEDVVEEIFGEIRDEYDTSEDWTEEQVNAHTYLLSARHKVYDLNEKYGWHLPPGNYETLGGLLISLTKDIPTVDEVIGCPPYTFTIVSLQDARIDTVKVAIG